MTSLADQIGQLSPDKIRQLAQAINRKKPRPSGPPPQRHHGRTEYPLSLGQERLWFLDQLAPRNAAYNWPFGVRFNFDVDPDVFRRTLVELAARHEVLRTTYPAVGSAPVQRIAPPGDVVLRLMDLSDLPDAAGETEAMRLIGEDARTPFDLANGPLCRYQLFHLGPSDWMFAGTMHHSVGDAWSRKVLMEDLIAIWRALATGLPPQLPALPIQYGDYAVWQREWLQGEVGDRLLSYWKRQLQDLPLLELPTDYPRPAITSFQGTTEWVSFSKPLTEALRAVGRQESATLFMTFLAVFHTLLMRYSGQTDIAGAIPVANRDRVELERLIGFFVNTLVLRVDLSGNPTFRELLRRVRTVCIEGYAHQAMPFERVVEELQPKRDLSRNPLASFIFQLEDIPRASSDVSRGAATRPLEVDAGTTIFDIDVHLYEAWDSAVLERQEGIRGTFTYSSDLFKPQSMQRLLGHYQTLLESVAADPDRRIWDLPMLSDADRRELEAWNDTDTEQTRTLTVIDRFEAHAATMPEAAAVVSGGRTLTYAELNRRANQLAHHLRGLGVGPDAIVAICVERSVDMVAALVGVLKAGAAYAPLDPEYPGERLRLMLADARAPVVLTEQPLVEKISAGFGGHVVCLDAEWQRFVDESPTNPTPVAHPENLAYVIYTSGSTGRPKGVAIEHRQLQNYVTGVSNRLELRGNMRFATVSTFAADLGNTVVYPALCGGGTLHVIPTDLATQPANLARYFEQYKIDCLKITPTHLGALLAEDLDRGLIPGERLVFGGEALSADLVERLRPLKPNTRIFNHYGPAECTVGCLTCEANARVPRTLGGSTPIGTPLPNVRVHVLDPWLKPVPVGVAGELYVGGAGVGRGYVNRPDATAERYVPDPFSPEPGRRLYRTGDRARWLADGNIEFLGRVDHQVKIRGYRVELGEIEVALSQHPDVEEAAVVVREEDGDRQLLAGVVPCSRDVDAGDGTESHERIAEWQRIYEELHHQPPAPDRTFDTVGWNSSYTGLPIPDEEMHESVDGTVARILALRPRRVLEIGCGTGLLLFRVAPHCEEYCATDFSSSALRYVEEQVAGRHLPRVTLLNRTADDFSGLARGAFDVVVLNSVVQYFPGVAYLLRVLEGAAGVVAPGGYVFVGDVRSLPLLETFHGSVAVSRAAISVPVEKLRRTVQKRLLKDEECVIAPAFFTALSRRFPAITAADIQLKRGRHHNELTKFRYDVVLQVGGDAGAGEVNWRSWDEEPDLSAVGRVLHRERPARLGIRGVPNARLAADWKAAELLKQVDRPVSVGELKQILEERESSAVDPEAFWSLGDRLGYAVAVKWSGAGRPDCVDVLMRASDDGAGDRPALLFPDSPVDASALRPWRTYANNPLRGTVTRDLVQQLRRDLAEKLPHYMIPGAFSVLDRLPLMPSGKVDRRRLQQADTEDLVASEHFVAPRDSFELRLAQIWEDALGVQHIGVRDSFFDLGGHSLLAVRVIARTQKTFGRMLPLATLFEKPTIEQLAALLRRGFNAAELSPLVPLRETGNLTPLFLVHPAGGAIMCYYDLSRYLGPDRPLYGLQFQGFEDRPGGVVPVEEMAARYVSAIQKAHPQGPYLLGGWSLGGSVAFEMARQLHAQGQAVPFVLMLDTRGPLDASRTHADRASRETGALISFAQRLEIYSGRPFPVSEKAFGALGPDEQIDYLVAEMKSRNMVPEEVDASWMRAFLAVYENNVNAAAAYAGGRYSGPVILFRSKDVLPEIEQEYPDLYRDPSLGWQAHCSEPITMREVPGNHLSMMTAPHVQVLARSIRESLERLYVEA